MFDHIKRGVLRKRCSKNMQQIYKGSSMPKYDREFIEIALRHGCSLINLLHIFRTDFLRNTSEGLLLTFVLTMLQVHLHLQDF